MTSRSEGVKAKIYSEGYCCLFGYLSLCKTRGETPKAMAAFIDKSPNIIWHHYRNLAAGKITCERKSDCLDSIIEEIKKGAEAP